MTATGPAALARRLAELRDARSEASERFFVPEAERIARLCHRMAERFTRGGRLLALGETPQARSDAHHVAVEFVHPVIVGKRALPALAVAADDLPLLARPDDMVIAFEREVPPAAVELGCLAIAFTPAGAEWVFEPPTGDPFVRQELVETLYHVLWELCHVFFDHIGGSTAGAGASDFLYPFLGGGGGDLEPVVDDVRRSALMKAREASDLRARTLDESQSELTGAAAMLASALQSGGTVLAFGNGGSATDAADMVADLRSPPQGWPARRAIDLTADSAILTALANDIGPDVLFARQIIAYGAPGDAVLALSTSGNSTNVVEALREARRRGLGTVAMVGYDGGRVAAERLADHVVVARSEHIPRIQEAHAAAYHVLRELLEAES